MDGGGRTGKSVRESQVWFGGEGKGEKANFGIQLRRKWKLLPKLLNSIAMCCNVLQHFSKHPLQLPFSDFVSQLLLRLRTPDLIHFYFGVTLGRGCDLTPRGEKKVFSSTEFSMLTGTPKSYGALLTFVTPSIMPRTQHEKRSTPSRRK